MKKLTLFVCALALSVAAFALPIKNSAKNAERSNITIQKVQFDPQALLKNVSADLDTLLLPYNTSPASFRIGTPDFGIYYSFYQLGLVAPYSDTIIFYNDSMYNASWVLGGKTVAENAWFYKMPVTFEENDLPLMKVNSIEGLFIPDYQVAGKRTAYLQGKGLTSYHNAINVAPAEYLPLTQCSNYTEKSASATGQDCLYQVSAGSLGNYCYGTKCANPWQNTTLDTIAVRFEHNGVMSIDHITLGIYTVGSSSAAIFPGENDHIRLTVYAMNKQGVVDWSKPFASTTANLDNYLPDDEDSTIGLLEFDFLEEDPATGALTPTSIEVEGSFVVVLDEFNDGTANFGILSDYYVDNKCNTFFPWYDIAEKQHYNSRVFGCNIMLNVVGYMPAFESPVEVAFAKGETEKALDVPSNVWDDDIEIDAPEWIEVEVATDYKVVGEGEDEEWHHLYNDKLTIKVEDSNEAREGEVVLTAYGLTKKILVKQNGGTQGINNIKAVNDNKLYNVLGQEVNEDYKGVVIRNGEKFVR